jgi:dephospho-CoA kinase
MGSGKSSVGECLRAVGYEVLDADVVARTVLGPGTVAEAAALATFGEVARGSDGHIDRHALGRLVFSDPAALARLEGLIHPHVRATVAARRAELEARGARAAFYDVPLLFEKKMEADFDAILVVSAPEPLRLERVQRRTGLSVAEIEERWRRQLPPEFKEARASFVVVNDSDLPVLRSRVEEALRHLGLPSPAPA